MIPQIIYFILVLISWMTISYLHGKPKEGNYNIFVTILSTLINMGLLFWGGFFDCFFK